MKSIEINCLFYQEEDTWVAQGLEYDITAQASSLPEAHKKFFMKLIAEVVIAMDLGREPYFGLAPAPGQFWRLFDESKMAVTRDSPPVRIEDGGATVPAFLAQMKIAESPVEVAA